MNKLIENNRGLFEHSTGGGFEHAAMETGIRNTKGDTALWLMNEYSDDDGPDTCVPTDENALTMFALDFDDHTITPEMLNIMEAAGLEQVSDEMWYYTETFSKGYIKMVAVTYALEELQTDDYDY